MMNKSMSAVVVASVLAVVGRFGVAQAPAAAVLTVKPITVRTTEFDPKKPPAKMPKLKAPEKVACDIDLYCSAGVGGGGCPSDDGKSVAAQVTSVQVLLQCQVTSWTPKGAPKPLLDHVAGHQAIVEAYYKHADAIAHSVADAYIGKKITFKNGPDVQADLNAALKKTGEEIEAAVKAKLMSDKAQEKFDAITHFGQTKVQTPVAVKQALAATDPDLAK